MKVKLIENGIKKLESLDSNDPTAYDQATLAYKEMGGKPFMLANTSEPIVAFRARTHDDNVFYEDFADVMLPPAYRVVNYGRCNIPFQAMFYCSDFRPTSYMELLQYWVKEKTKNPILYVTISKWRFNKPIRVLIVTSPNPDKRISDYDKVQGKILDDFLNSVDNETKDALTLLYEFLFEKFRKPAKNDVKTYIITAAYCNLAIINGLADAIYYPSVPYDGKGVNLALRTYYEFGSNASLELVARDTFERDDTGKTFSFKHIGFKEAASIDIINKKIHW